MLDLYMVLLLAVTFALFYGFVVWCDRTIEEPAGGDRPWSSSAFSPCSSFFISYLRWFTRKSF